mmetsp:Transcript_7362/g.18892  ORF Transcript_7362/g.18892 Transcript_7362/m.18892 type:complete len:88 (-) Transcript_7362:1417-1680(-)
MSNMSLQEVIEHCWDGLSRMLWLEQKHGRKVLRMARKLDKEIGQRFVSLPKDKITAHKRSRQEMKRHIDLELHKLQAQKQFPFSLQG